MKFNIPMVHLRGATLRIAVTTDGSVVAMCGDTVIAQFGEGSVEQKPSTDMMLDVFLGDGERLTVEIDAKDIRVNEYGYEESIYHPSYRSVLNNEAREFARTICKQSLTNDIVDVVRAALTHAQDEVGQLRDELRVVQEWRGQ